MWATNTKSSRFEQVEWSGHFPSCCRVLGPHQPGTSPDAPAALYPHVPTPVCTFAPAPTYFLCKPPSHSRLPLTFTWTFLVLYLVCSLRTTSKRPFSLFFPPSFSQTNQSVSVSLFFPNRHSFLQRTTLGVIHSFFPQFPQRFRGLDRSSQPSLIFHIVSTKSPVYNPCTCLLPLW